MFTTQCDVEFNKLNANVEVLQKSKKKLKSFNFSQQSVVSRGDATNDLQANLNQRLSNKRDKQGK